MIGRLGVSTVGLVLFTTTCLAASSGSGSGPENVAATATWDGARTETPEPKRWEVTLGPGLLANSDVSAGGLGGHIGLGYFIFPSVEISLRETFVYSSFPNGTNWMALSRGAVDYQFNLGRWHPFFGFQAGYGIGIHNTSSIELGAQLGVKFDLTPDVALIVMGEYDNFIRQRAFETGIREDSVLLFIGIGVRW